MKVNEGKMILETERLNIQLLTKELLEVFCNNLDEFEEKTQLIYDGEELSGGFLYVVNMQKEACCMDSHNLKWNSLWIIIRKDNGVVIGSCAFKHTPNDRGEVEVGYGLKDKYFNCGYMSECIQELSNWAINQTDVSSVIAETEQGNDASEKVLIKCGFEVFKKESEATWWQFRKGKK